ncbi:MAG: putative cytosolic protein [Gammaproteobacteria bacterium]|jgi:hypothetical protein|nr:putative cytosolic protein [Gammaproteobacteria bacterium]MCE3237766.1 putative cytosolic protein [Gammaproteobacteria bacterium]
MRRNQSDTAWKIILDSHLKDFFDYCLPELSQLINWKKLPVPLDKELEAITKGNNTGKRLVDKLLKIYFKNGHEQWVLIHIEVQGKPDNDFPKRMFTYAYRIFDKYQKPVISCAILTDERKDWRPNHYEMKIGGCYLGSRFLVVKLLDYSDRQNELEISDNLFANVILVQLKALEIKSKSDNQRKQAKFALTRRLYEKGFNKLQIVNLYQFIDWLIGLPEPLEVEYLNKVYDFEEEKKMSYVSFAEQRGINKGLKEGLKKGLKEGLKKGTTRTRMMVAKRLLQAKIDKALIKKTTGLSIAEIKASKKK